MHLEGRLSLFTRVLNVTGRYRLVTLLSRLKSITKALRLKLNGNIGLCSTLPSLCKFIYTFLLLHVVEKHISQRKTFVFQTVGVINKHSSNSLISFGNILVLKDKPRSQGILDQGLPSSCTAFSERLETNDRSEILRPRN